jgi:hypothetical protein
MPYNLINKPGEPPHVTPFYWHRSSGSILSQFAPNNSDACEPQDTSEWPPAIILNVFYATAVLKAWGPQMFVKYVRERSKDADEDEDEGDDNEVEDDVQEVNQILLHAHGRSLSHTS